MTGIGGDCFCLVAKPGKKIWGYNGSGRAAAGVSTAKLLELGIAEIDADSIHAVTVPGAIEAWSAILEAHGRFGLDRALQPAIRYAERGFPVAPRVAHDWALVVERLAGDPGASRHYLIDGKAPAMGEVVQLPALAASLRAIAAQGPRAFYEGALAEDIAQTVAARGGFLTVEDFASHRGEVAEAIGTGYRGLDVVELPPNGQGLIALVLLNILECFDLAALDPLGDERFHVALEAARLAYALRDDHLADPASMRVSVAKLLDKAFAAELARRIDRAQRMPEASVTAAQGDTVYLTVVDRDRMAVSLINSLYRSFGAGVATEKTGILLQNRGACFVVEPGHPNTIEPRKRSLHTIIPALAMRKGRCELAFGVMGSHFQPMGHALLIGNLIDYGMDIQQAIDAPRVFFEDEETVAEEGLAAATVEGLRARGHQVATRELPLGGGQAIQIDWERGTLTGGSDPRKDGCALGY
jgi:gamma-glutamyltranspeptidase/glutathione hydrolase